MAETFIFPQELAITYTNVASFPLPYISGVPFFDLSTKVLVVSTASRSSGTPVAGDFVTVLPQHKSDGTHGPKVTITQTAADNALIIAQQGNAAAVSLICGSTNSGRALDISQAAATDVITINKTHTGVGSPLVITNAGAGEGLFVTQNGNGSAMRLVQNTNNASFQVDKVNTSNGDCAVINNAGIGSGLRVAQSGAAHAIHVTGSFGNSSAAGILFEKLAPANTDIQMKFRRSDGSGDPDLNLTYWGQSNINTLGLTPDTGNGLHVTTNGRVVVGDFTPGNFTGSGKFAVMDGYTGIGTVNPTARLHVAQTSADPAVVIIQSANSNALNVTRSHTGSGADAINIRNDGNSTAIDLEQAGASGVALNIDHSSSSSALVITKVNTSSANSVIWIQNNAASTSALDIRGDNGSWSVTKAGDATFNSVNVGSAVVLNQVTSTFSGGGVASASISLPAGTWMLRVDVFFHQSKWSSAAFVIDGTTLQTTDNLGDQAGTGYTVMFGAKSVSSGTRTATVTTDSTSIFGAGPQARWLFMAWRTQA